MAEKVFKIIGIVVVLLFVGSLLFILLFGGGEQGIDGAMQGQRGAMQGQSGGMQDHGGGMQAQGGGKQDHGVGMQGQNGGMQGQGGGQSFLLTGPVLLALTGGYLAMLALWGGLHRKYLLRHVASAAAMWLLVVLYLNALGGFEYDRHIWNRSFANASVVLYAVTLAIGPLARLWQPASQALAWRRETGIWATIAAAVHVGIFWEGTYGWEGWRRFFYGSDGTLMGGTALNVANVVGLVALVYALVLTVTSNDAGQRWLKSGWSWLQKRSTTMWVLVLLHTWFFAYFITVGPFGNELAIGILWSSFWAVLLLQTAAFIKTVWFQR